MHYRLISAIVLAIWINVYTILAEKKDSIISNSMLVTGYLGYSYKSLWQTMSHLTELERLRTQSDLGSSAFFGISFRDVFSTAMSYQRRAS